MKERNCTPEYRNLYDNPDHLITQAVLTRILKTFPKELIAIWS